MADLFLRRVNTSPRAVEAYRVIFKTADRMEFEIGSIGPHVGAHQRQYWHWGIDTVLPRQAFETRGEARDREDAMSQFRAVWEVFASDPERLEGFLEMKRTAR